ncbi:ATPase, T2SS/T4P/T4SS family, partial [Methanosarcina mazei]
MTLNFIKENDIKLSYGLPNFREVVNKVSEQFTKNYRELLARSKRNIPDAVVESKQLIYTMLPVLIDESDEGKVKKIAEEIFYDVIGLGPIHEIYYKEGKTDLFIDGPHHIYYKNTKNRIIDTDIRFRDEEHLQLILDKLLDPVGESLDKTHLSVECALEDGTRLSAFHNLISDNGTYVTFRFHNKTIFTQQELIELKTINDQIAWFYNLMVRAGLSVILYGDTGSGKTASAASLISMHPYDLRIALISDVSEIFVKKKDPKRKIVEVHSRNKGDSIFTTYDGLIKMLRHQVDRIYFNEVRDHAFLTLLEAWGTGHPGGAGIHAGNIDEAWSRMIIMLKRGDNSLTDELCSRMIASTVDILIECR